MAAARAIAGVVADAERRVRRKIATRAWTLFIDGTAHRIADLAFERDAAWWRFVGAAHTHQRRGQRHGERHGNARRLV